MDRQAQSEVQELKPVAGDVETGASSVAVVGKVRLYVVGFKKLLFVST